MGCLIAGLGLIILICLWVATLSLTSAYQTWNVASQLHRSGVTVGGRVTARNRVVSGRSVGYSIKYSYEYGGKEYSSEQKVRRGDYERSEDTVPIRCLPENPATARLYNNGFGQMVFYLFVACTFLFGGSLCLILIISSFRTP